MFVLISNKLFLFSNRHHNNYVMVSIVITNTRCKIVGELHPEKEHQYAFHNMLREKCGYMVPNAEWSPAYKNNVWDCIISLYDKKTQSFPTGLLSNVLKSLKSQVQSRGGNALVVHQCKRSNSGQCSVFIDCTGTGYSIDV